MKLCGDLQDQFAAHSRVAPLRRGKAKHGRLKNNYVCLNLSKIDAESSNQWKKIYGMKGLNISADESSQKTSLETCSATIERIVLSGMLQALEETLEEVQLCSRLEELLLKKKTIKKGNTLVMHNEKGCPRCRDPVRYDAVEAFRRDWI
ncbi:hypothetical protein KSP40_PGU015174 [Platanthera guangdongensis]|uniref:Uncharacterized protein n=1 Tax=Platanthera guangdongensis TaxID=2320717 RepID=A0ABR2LT09_9ASPA